MRPKYLLIAISILLLIQSAAARELSAPKVVDHLTTSSGLTHNAVSAMIHDSKGYLWIGTFDGISIYDGKNISQIRRSNQHRTLISNRVRGIAEDIYGNMLIGTESGVTYFERETNRFINAIEGISVYKLLYDPKTEQTYTLDNKGCIRIYNKLFSLQQKLQLPMGGELNSMRFLNDHTIITHTIHGAWLLDCDAHAQLREVKLPHMEYLTYISVINDNTILLANGTTIIEGCIDLEGEHTFTPTFTHSYSSVNIRALDTDQNGGLWICDRGNNAYYVPNFKSNDKIEPITTKGILADIYCHSSDQIWVSSFDNGVYRLSSRGNSTFTNILGELEIKQTKILHYEVVDNEQILVKTQAGVLKKLELSPLRETKLIHRLSASELNSNKDMLYDKQGDTWLFNHDSSFILCREDGSIMRGTLSGIGSDYKVPLCSIEDSAGYIWLSFNNGVFRFKPNKNSHKQVCYPLSANSFFKNGETHPKSRVIYSDPLLKNVVWIGTKEQGLIRVEGAGSIEECSIRKFKHDAQNLKSLPSNFVSAIMRHSNGSLWIGTESGGVARMDDNSESGFFTTFDTNQGLSNDVVKCIVEDHNSNIWIGTNDGLNMINITTDQVYSYGSNNGLPFTDFWYFGSALSSGDILLSGVNGLMLFNPNKLSTITELPNFEFSSLKLQNTEIQIGDTFGERVVMERRLTDGSELLLKSNENIVSIGVDVIDFNPRSNNYIKYQLLPISETWISVPATTGCITLSGIPTGDYELNVAISDSFGRTSEPKTLYINVDYAPFMTPLHIAIYVIVAVMVILLLIVLYNRNIQTQYMLDREMQQVANLKNLNEEKQRYFSNISHELKTPLALIVAPIESLSQRFKFDVDITSKIDIIMRQSRRMLQLIDSTHKLHLDELNLLKPTLSHFDISLFIEDMVEDFRFDAEYNDKRLLTSGRSIIVEADQAMLEMAISNILNNAFKYTRSGDEISVEYQPAGDNIIITIKDSGQGISQDDLANIFDRYYMGKSSTTSRSGSGIGLSFTKRIIELHNGTIEVESHLGMGSTFTITLPIVISLTSNTQTIEKATDEHQKSLAESLIVDRNEECIVPEALRQSLVYVVEDNPLMRTMIGEALSPYFQVMTFGGGDECMKQINTLWPQIVVSDVIMDGGDGYELCDSIKSNVMTSHIPVILLTGCNSMDDKLKGYESGADGYISKPFYLTHLVSRITHLLNSREELRRRFEIGVPFEQTEESDLSSENEFISRLYAIFEKHIEDDQIDIDYIASEMMMSRSSLYQKVKSLTGGAPYELLRDYRLKRAAELLAEGKLNVTEVFMAVGFKHRTHFSRLFKDQYGVSPSKYEQTVNRKNI